MKIRKTIMLIALTIIFYKPGYSQDTAGRMGLGLGVNTLHIKYGLSQKWAIASSIACGEKIWIMGGRLLYSCKDLKRTTIYSGIEICAINFQDVEELSGRGLMFGVPVGVESFLLSKFSLSTEIGPYVITLTPNNFDLYHTGIEWIWNIYLNFWFKD